MTSRSYINKQRPVQSIKRIVNKIMLGSCKFGKGKIIQVTGSSEVKNDSPFLVAKT